MRRSIPSSKAHCDTARQKRELRLKKRAELEGLSDEYITASNAAIQARLISLPEYASAKQVFVYCAVGREVATQGIISHALSVGKTVALPLCGDNSHMSFKQITDLSELHTGKFGIPEPEPENIELSPTQGDMIIVPALCCDERGNRLGHGAGYYDRYLANAGCFTVCLCRRKMLEKQIPTEPTDVKTDLVLTE